MAQRARIKVPSKLARSGSQRVARLVSNVRVRSSPSQPCAILFHPPDPPIASNRFPSDVRFAQASTVHINGPSKLLVAFQERHACRSYCALDGPSKLATDPLRDKADWPLTARFDEHRPKCSNKFHHACASGEHKRPTAFVFRLPARALREHGSDVRILPLLFWCARLGEKVRPTAPSISS